MTLVPARSRSPEPVPADAAAHLLARQLAAAGLKVEISRRRDTCELTILDVANGKSFLALDPGGQGRWYYEPAAGPATSPAVLASIITHLLGASPAPPTPAAYRALPLKGQVGRSLQDRGMAVALRVSEDLDSFEATTDIEVTSPARPHLGTVTLSDDAAVDWRCDLRSAFEGSPAAWTDVVTPVLRHR